jgi:formamidopyrimidine-DNA glycosylase
MIEIPEAASLTAQIRNTFTGKKIKEVIAAQSPHKFAWYQGEPESYRGLLTGKTVTDSHPVGGMVEIEAEDVNIVLSEGAKPSFFAPGEKLPKKHQLLLQFGDGSNLCVSVQMYGGILAFTKGEGDNQYYLLAKEKPTPLMEGFSRDYFDSIFSAENIGKLSAKAFLATEQRIPGLGNGTLQDILFNAKIHPKRKMDSISKEDTSTLFESTRNTLAEMAQMGGRDTEKDLFGEPGGYQTRCSKNTVGKPCKVCGSEITKASYMGGSIYFCPGCQPLDK